MGMNIGKKNETSPEEQAISEATSKWEKKEKTGYTDNITAVDTCTAYVEPMLAKKYGDVEFSFPIYSQPKLDGCVSFDTMVDTDMGTFRIGDIVEKNIKCNVKSYNETSRKTEYKPIVAGVKDGVDIRESKKTQWYELEFSDGMTLRATGNHLVYLPRLKCWRRVDELLENDVLMKNI